MPSRRTATSQRRAAVLICVLAILLIVGLLISQTVQTLVLVRRGDAQRRQLRQARELIELGNIVLRQNDGASAAEELVVPLVEVADVHHFPSSGSISLQRVDSDNATRRSVRITVKYPLGSLSEFTATELAELEEVKHETPE